MGCNRRMSRSLPVLSDPLLTREIIRLHVVEGEGAGLSGAVNTRPFHGTNQGRNQTAIVDRHCRLTNARMAKTIGKGGQPAEKAAGWPAR